VKQAISFSVNTAAATFFVFSGEVVWLAALVMALAGRIPQRAPSSRSPAGAG